MFKMSEALSKILSQRPPSILYHYTTGQGYLGIINSKEIWATSIHYLNDASEFRLASEISENLLRTIENSLYDKLIIRILAGLESYEKVNIFVASFSEQRDQLSQWRAYCGEFGFSIGFKVERLINVAIKNEFLLAPCCYDYVIQERIISDILGNFIARFKAESNKAKNDEMFDAICGSIGLDCAKEITRVAPILKDKSFEEEKEWRLISGLTSSRDVQIDFRVGKSMLVPYYHLNLNLNKEKDIPIDIVKELFVGPTPHPIEARKAAIAVLSRNNFDGWSVYRSATPYRNW